VKSIGARLTAWYAGTATATLAILFVGGYFLLLSNLTRGLDLLNAAEFEQIRSRLGDNPAGLDPVSIDEHIRETTEYAKVLFYIDVHSREAGTVFRSTNLSGQTIPDVPGEKKFTVEVPDIGEMRVGEFIIPPYEVNIATSMRQVREAMTFYVNVCFALLGAMLLASLVIGFGLSRLVLRPVRAIRETAVRIGMDNIGERIPVYEVKDEISDLARLLNEMFDRLAASFEQVRRFTADASHELKTPLALVRLHAEKLLMDDSLPRDARESLQVQLEELQRLHHIIEELLFLSLSDARAIKLEPRAQDPAAFLANFAQDAAALAEHHGCRFQSRHSGEGTAAFEPNRLRQVLLNLLSNAIKASPEGGLITLESYLGEGVWRVSVADEGPGLNPEQRQVMFDRFVRFPAGNADDRGSGLGLAICRGIIQLHGGRIHAVAARTGRGLCVVFEIPAEPAGQRSSTSSGLLEREQQGVN